MSIIKVSAKLDRTDSQTPWGFRMAGGKDYYSPLIIQKVNPGSLSSKCGIKENDTITHIGGFDVSHLTHKDAQDLIIGSGNNLELKLERSSGTSHNSGNDGYFQQHQSLPWQQQPYKPTTGMIGLAPKPFQKPGAVTTITSHMSNFNIGVAPTTTTQGHNLPWSRTAHQSFGAPTQHHSSGTVVWRPQIPAGERKMKIGRPGQAQKRPPMAGTRIPICTSCHTSIRGPFVTALDKTWCPEHFVCANPNCSQPLFDCGFVEEADQLYCEKDYEKYLAPRCARCSGAIVGEVVLALGLSLHPDCFTCHHCKNPIPKFLYRYHSRDFYCLKDWGALFQTKCYGCQFPIEPGDRWVEALSQNWHSECFNCSTCQINLEGQSFCAKNGKPYCKKHGAARRF